MKKQKSNLKINNGKLVILFSFLLIIVIALYAILNIGIFNSKNTVIEGNNYVDKDYIVNLLEIKTDKNIFRYNINNMEKLLLNNRYIESVKIKRLLPNTIKISIVEKEISAILYNSDNMYCYVDDEINFIDQTNIENKENNILLVNTDYELNKMQEINFNDKQTRDALINLLNYIKEEGFYKKIEKIDITDINSIKMYTDDDIKISLKNNELLKYNISKLALILYDLQSKNQYGGEIDLSMERYALYRNQN